MFGSLRSLFRNKQRRRLLHDHFGKPAAAGSVNATPAVPGPGGLRTVTDTTNLMQVGPWKTGASLADETKMSATFGAANNRCSYADGQAWVGFAGADFGNAGLTADRWYLLVMQDSSSKLAYCYVKGGDVGAGEALGSELITNGAFAEDSGWTKEAGWSISGGAAAKIPDASGRLMYQSISFTRGKSYKSALDVSACSGNMYLFIFSDNVQTTPLIVSQTGTFTGYGVAVTTTARSFGPVMTNAASTCTIDNVTLREVTTPSAQCLYAYKSVNGSQGWHMDGTFNMNASAYTYDIYELGETALVCAGGKSTAGWGDPGLWWPAVTIRLGLTMVVGPVTVVNTSTYSSFGFDADNQTLELQANSVRFDTGGTLCARNATDTPITVTSFSANTPYYLAIRLLAAGAEYYLRTLTGYWKLLWRGGTNATATLYPGISNYSAAFTLSKPGMQLLPAPWNPSCLLYDSFTRADGAVGSSESMDGLGVSAPVRTYAQVGTWAISSNTLACSALDGGLAVILADTLNPDQMIDLNVTRTAGVAGIICRYADANNYVRCVHDGINIVLTKVVSGSPSTVATTVTAYSAGAQMRVRADDTSFWVWYNNALIGTVNTISDAALQTSGKVGAYTTDTGNTFDVLWSSAYGNSNEFRELDNYIH